MSDRDLDVYLDWQGETRLVGRLWARSTGSKETSSFEYDGTWLAREDRFSLDPALPLAEGQFHTGEDVEHMIIERHISKQRGSWRMFSAEVETSSDAERARELSYRQRKRPNDLE